MLEIIREKGIETSIKLRMERTKIINRAKGYINNQMGEIPGWGKAVLGFLGMLALLTIITLGYNWATDRFGTTTNHVDTQLDKWTK